jgi:hypothetical protein
VAISVRQEFDRGHFRFSTVRNVWYRPMNVARTNVHMSVNFTGVWHANLSKSRFLGPLPIAITIKVEHSDPELQEKILVTKFDGNEERVVFKCWTNGKEGKSLLNGRAVRGNARWEGEELAIESWMQFGTREMHFCDCWSLSPDGQILSMEHRKDDLVGQLTVLDRAG